MEEKNNKSIILKKHFYKYLNDYEVSKSFKGFNYEVDWELIISLFELEFNSLWKSFELSKISETYSQYENSFKSLILFSIQEKLFHAIFILNKNSFNDNLSVKEFSNRFTKFFTLYMKDVFNVFISQKNLTSLSYNNDSNILLLKLKENEKNIEFGKKFNPGKKFRIDEVPVFENIIKLKRSINKNLSYKQICDIEAEKQFNYTSYEDLEKFYRRFLTYKKKQSK